MIHQRFRGFKCLQDAVSVWGKRQGRGQRGRSPAEDAKTHISTFPPRLGGTKEDCLIFIQRESRWDLGYISFYLLQPHFPLEQEKRHRAQIRAIFLAKPQTRPHVAIAIQFFVFEIIHPLLPSAGSSIYV